MSVSRWFLNRSSLICFVIQLSTFCILFKMTDDSNILMISFVLWLLFGSLGRLPCT